MAALPNWAERQPLEDLSAAVMRALTGRAWVHFEGGRPWDGERPLPDRAPHLQAQIGLSDTASYRGLADSLALRVRYSDQALHRHLMPDGQIQVLIFEWLEQMRVESIAPVALPGLRLNVIERYRKWSDLFLNSGSVETDIGIMLFCFSQMVWSRLMALALPDPISDLLEPTRAALGVALGANLKGMAAHRHDQLAYAQFALAAAQDMAARVQANPESLSKPTKGWRGDFSVLLEFDASDTTPLTTQTEIEAAPPRTQPSPYRVFARHYDLQKHARDVVRPALLAEFRQTLDDLLAQQKPNIGRLARKIRAALAHLQHDGWLFDQEDGVIDGRCLARLICSPSERHLFRTDRFSPVSDAEVTFLVDCSGSMKHHGTTLALTLDVLVRAFELAGVCTEVLGFTTNTWNGGRPAREWATHKTPSMPGRLNELNHLIFKDAQTPWKSARLGLGALMKPDLFKEGVDGEALSWACQRQLSRGKPRRIVLVISDGGPMDSATLLANGPHYLDEHLIAVVRHYEREHQTEIIGIGVGQDISAYYRRSLAIDLSQGLDRTVLDAFIKTLLIHRRKAH